MGNYIVRKTHATITTLGIYCEYMMMLCHGNDFHNTGPLWVEATNGFPSQKSNNAEFDVSFFPE